MRVAITGGSGSLGTALIGRLADMGAERIVTFSRDEQKRLAMAEKYRAHPGIKVYAGDIRDRHRLADLFVGCEVVVHAAARKVVSGHHDEPREMLQTNVIGTENVISAARNAKVGKMLFISSDKAVRAENVYGMSKAMAEQLVISENARSWPQGQRMSVIRYGNVLGSNGSVLKIWKQAAETGAMLRVSDERMTRFWLTIEQAAEFVLAAVACMRGGEVLVPQLKAASLLELAEAVAPGYATTNIGIRPGGEKLHEELLSAAEARRTVRRHGFYVVTPTAGLDSWDGSPWPGEPVSEGFTYQSDSWPLRYSPDTLRELLAEAK